MKKQLVIIKFGGSVITDKSKNRGVFRKAVVRRLAKEIVEARKKKDFDLILVHGAGAYAHFLSTKYRLTEGNLGKTSLLGFAKIKKVLFELNNMVWNECLAAELMVSTIQPSAVIITNNGKITRFDTRVIEGLLKLGVVPLLMADVTLDEKNGIAILSGDQTVGYLARKFRAEKVIFVSDVDGVYDKNPKIYKDAKLITEINNKNFKNIINSMETYNINDASGEMKGKLLAIGKDLRGIETLIIGFGKRSLREALLDRGVGTRVTLKHG